jgi:prefoldin subunit 5
MLKPDLSAPASRATPISRAWRIRGCLATTIAAIVLLFLSPLPAAAQTAATGGSVIASPAASAIPIRNGTPGAQPSPTQIQPGKIMRGTADDSRRAIISYLGQVIGWYRQLEVDAGLATEPAETLFVADDRQMAGEILKLAFEYARGATALLRASTEGTGTTSKAETSPQSVINKPEGTLPRGEESLPGIKDLTARLDQAKAELNQAKIHLQELRNRLASAARRDRDALNRQLVAIQGGVDLAQSRVDSLAAMVEFETGTTANGRASAGIEAQIEELERSIPQANEKLRIPATQVAPMPSAASQPSGILGRAEGLLALRHKEQTLSNSIALTSALLASAASMRAPLTQDLRDVDRQGRATQVGLSDLATIKQSKAEIEKLTERRKLVVTALLPLSKQIVILNLYSASLTPWRRAVHQQFSEDLRDLIMRLLGLALLLGAVFAGATVWRKLTFRYVQDSSAATSCSSCAA